MTDTLLFWAEFWAKALFAGFLVVMGVIFLKRGLGGEEMKSQKYFKYGLAMFALMTSLTRSFFLVTDFHVEGTGIYNLFWRSAVVSSLIALIFITLVIETYLVKTKYFFTIVGIIGIVLIIFVDIPLVRQLNIPFYLLIGGEIFILYLYIAIKSPNPLRTKSLLMILSLAVFSAGIVFDSESFIVPFFGIDLGLVGVVLMWIGLGAYLKLNYTSET